MLMKAIPIVSLVLAVCLAEFENSTLKYLNQDSVFNFLRDDLKLESSITNDYDSVVIVATNTNPDSWGAASIISPAFEIFRRADKSFGEHILRTYLNDKALIFSPTGKLNRDYDDARVFSEAAFKGVEEALKTSPKRILVALPTKFAPFDGFNVDSATVLGALKALYMPLESREFKPDKAFKADRLGFLNFNGDENLFKYILSLEASNVVFRDIIMPDSERMAAPKVQEYVENLFPEGSPVKVRVISDREVFEEKYPCFAAVDRCAQQVPRHAGRIILLEYSEGTPEKVLGFVGKGVTFDSGGVNIKTGGFMVGMSRDKGGAAAVAGIFQNLMLNKPKNIRVFGAMCMVRNSIGADAYLVDEIIESRAGVRIRVQNTDAEGRMAMVDALAEMKERIIEENLHDKAHLFTIATLTGAAKQSMGAEYGISIDNGAARRLNTSQNLQSFGEELGDMIELGRLRREDFDAVKPLSPDSDLSQMSSTRSRGFQYPAAFLMRGSGLDKHDIDSDKPIPFTHIDIAGSGSNYPKLPHSYPIAALSYYYFHDREN